MNPQSERNRYLLTDSHSMPLAHAILESAPDAPTIQVRILNDKVEQVMEHETVYLLGMLSTAPDLQGKVIRSRGERILMENLNTPGPQFRKNLRIPTRFSSYIYPVKGGFKGRRPITGQDISCGGVAFFCEEPLQDGQMLEIVIPITQRPLLLKCQILRRITEKDGQMLYAAEFVNMCNDEESFVREAVFTTQLEQKRSRTAQSQS